MELKTARLTLLIDPNKKAAFERLCAQQDRTASQVVRQLIRDYLAEHGVDYTAASLDEITGQGAEVSSAGSARPKPALKSTTATPPSTKLRPGTRRR